MLCIGYQLGLLLISLVLFCASFGCFVTGLAPEFFFVEKSKNMPGACRKTVKRQKKCFYSFFQLEERVEEMYIPIERREIYHALR